MSLRLPSPGHLPTTGPVDAIAQYHAPLVGPLLRRRLVWVRRLLPAGRLDRVLEIGYGSGVFQYELARTARRSFAVDPHPHAARVRDRLAQDGVSSFLVRGDGARLPFADRSFDAVVLVSTLEFVPDPARCLRECWRVLAPGSRLVLLTPRELPLADALWRLVSGRDAAAELDAGRCRVRAALATALPAGRRRRRPGWVPGWLAPYDLVTADKERAA